MVARLCSLTLFSKGAFWLGSSLPFTPSLSCPQSSLSPKGELVSYPVGNKHFAFVHSDHRPRLGFQISENGHVDDRSLTECPRIFWRS